MMRISELDKLLWGCRVANWSDGGKELSTEASRDHRIPPLGCVAEARHFSINGDDSGFIDSAVMT